MQADRSNMEVAVRQLQIWLRALCGIIPGIGEVNATGKYDADTERAVRSFQFYCGMTPTGAVDLGTWERLKAEHRKTMESPKH